MHYLSSRGIMLKQVGKEYLWSDQNVWIHGHEWYSHYDQTGGNAISFVIKYFGKSFRDAVKELTGDTNNTNDNWARLSLPERNKNSYRVFMYLQNKRGIAPEVIDYFLKRGLIYEEKQYHNCVFVGRDDNGWVQHCHKRATISNFKQTIEGSKAEYSFHYNGWDDTIYAFEAPIDMLAYISMHQECWKKHSYVALCSVSEKALMYQLITHPQLKRIILCLDNDKAGKIATERIRQLLCDNSYRDVTVKIPDNKDWDEDLLSRNQAHKNI